MTTFNVLGAPFKIVELAHCRLYWTQGGCAVYFADGASCDAIPHDTPHYHVISHRCGYGDDVLAYCREHEFAHAFVEERLHNRPSRVLWSLAHCEPLTGPESVYEEATAQLFQRWLRANERPILAGVDWDGLKRDALALLG